MTFGTVAFAGVASDRIDAVMHRTGGERLAPPRGLNVDARFGEYDAYREHVSRRDLRRLVAAGLVSVHGWQADQLAHLAGWEGNADEFVGWYLGECLAGLDARAARREGRAWEELERPDWSYGECEAVATDTVPAGADAVPARAEGGDLPGVLVEWLGRLVYGAKADYAAAYAYYRCGLGERPAELTRFDSSGDSVIEDVCMTLQARSVGWAIDGKRLHNAVYELGINVEHHARAGGLAAVQHYPGERCVEFAIGDTGIGIRKSLNDAGHEFKTSWKAIRAAVETQVTRTGDAHRGKGLPGLRATICTNELAGVLTIFSGAWRVRYVAGVVDPQVDRVGHSVAGTIAVGRFRTG